MGSRGFVPADGPENGRVARGGGGPSAARRRVIAKGRRGVGGEPGPSLEGGPAWLDYLADIERYTLEGRAEAIRCPTFLALAESDPLAVGAQRLHDALTCKKTLVRFTAAQGAGDHCEMQNRSALNRAALDWLDEVLA